MENKAQEIIEHLRTHKGPRREHIADLAEWASWWHGGQTSPLYSFASTQKLVCNHHINQGDYLSEIDTCIRSNPPQRERDALDALWKFFEASCCDWEEATDNDHDHMLTPDDYARP